MEKKPTITSSTDVEANGATFRLFEWSDDDEETGGEDSRLLREFRARNNLDRSTLTNDARALPKAYNTRDQPAFHERNKSFTEKFCGCCVGPEERLDLSRDEVSPPVVTQVDASVLPIWRHNGRLVQSRK